MTSAGLKYHAALDVLLRITAAAVRKGDLEVWDSPIKHVEFLTQVYLCEELRTRAEIDD